MNNWNRLGLAGLLAAALALGAPHADAACIDTFDNTVDNPADCIDADGGSTKQCRLALAVDYDGAGTPPPDPKKIVCVDGAACDGDGAVNGSCTFRVGACLNIPNAGCDVEPVSVGEVKQPKDKDALKFFKTPSAAADRFLLQDALASLLPNAGTEACTDADLAFKVDMSSKSGICGPAGATAGAKCTSDLDCDDYCIPVFKKGKGKIQLAVEDSGKGAKSKLKLFCEPALAPFANGAEAFQIADPGDLIGGPVAMGRVGDYMIRNGRVRAVIRDVGRVHSFMLLNGGQIIDADLVRDDPSEDRDSWQGSQPLVNISSSQATDSVIVLNDGSDGQAAIVKSSGPDDLFDTIKGDVLVAAEPPLSVPPSAVDVNLPVDLSTQFILSPYSNSIQVATTVTNNTGAQLKYFMGDFINPGGQLEPFGPGQGFGETQLRNGSTSTSSQGLDYLAFQGRLDAAGVAYGMIFEPTNYGPRTTTNIGAFASSGVYAVVHNNNLLLSLFQSTSSKPDGGFTIPASGSRTYRRWFHIGETVGDVSEARTELFAFKRESAAVQGVVTVGGVPTAGAHVTLTNDAFNNPASCPDPKPDNCVNIFSSTLTDEHGFYRLVAPPGDYEVMVRKSGAPYEGSAAEPTKHPVVLKKKKATPLDIVLPGTGSVVVNVVDQGAAPIAAKVSVVGVPASPDPLNDEYPPLPLPPFVGRFFGFDFEEKGDVFGLAAAQFADSSGTTGSFDLEPGSYHVVVSHGYEYDVYDEVINVTAGATTTVNATVNQVVDTAGFVSIDTHVHMLNSPDSNVSRERRIISMLGEGVDFFVNTDHDFTHSLADEIADLGVGSLVGNAPSVETTTSHYGHFNTWPITVDGGAVDGGAIDWSFHLGDVNGSGYPSDGAYDNLPSEIFAEAVAYPGNRVVQVNHFNSGTLGHFNMLGIDTAQIPPASSNAVYRCVGGTNAETPCNVRICIDGTNDGASCTADVDCPGGGTCPTVTACAGGGTCTLTGSNLGSFLRLDPAVANLYDDGFTALEVWIEAGRGQTALLLGDNMADWFNLLNQGRFKAGVADSDTHSSISVQAGGPRTFVASSTDAPGSIDADEIAGNVNDMRAIGSNGPFMTVELENGVAATASHALVDSRTVAFSGGGSDSINIHIEAPTWAEYDTIDVYMNSVPDCRSEWTFFGVINPSKCDTVAPFLTLTKALVASPTAFTVSTSTGVSGFGTRQITDVSIPVTISADTWVVVVARGTDGVSAPLFPMQPQDLETTGNSTLADLTDSGGSLPWNVGEEGALALAYSNPLFFDDGDNFCHGGTACPGL